MLSHMADLLSRLSVVQSEELLWVLFGWIDHAPYNSWHLVSYGKVCSRLLSSIYHH